MSRETGTVCDGVGSCCVFGEVVGLGDQVISGYGGQGQDPVLLYVHMACVPARSPDVTHLPYRRDGLHALDRLLEEWAEVISLYHVSEQTGDL